jgi:hypothetical protein
MDYPTFMCVPLFAWGNSEAIELAFGIGELNTISSIEVAARR